MKISIINYGLGNTKSIENAFKKFNINILVTSNKTEILNSDGCILPGVGSFHTAIKILKDSRLDEIIIKLHKNKVPILGICLGMQLLFQSSIEKGENRGLGLIDGNIKKLKYSRDIRLPHMGWNENYISAINKKNKIIEGLESNFTSYFVHNYCLFETDNKNILATCKYGSNEFITFIQKDNTYGCQFHPEKSSDNGLMIIKNFIEICKKGTK